MMKLGDSSRRLEYVKVDQIDGRRYKIEIWRKDERDGRLKLIMRLKKDEGAQSHRAENSAMTFTDHPVSAVRIRVLEMAKHVRCESLLAG